MKYKFTFKFVKSYNSFPKSIQVKFDKQLAFLLQNMRHPSLHAKKYSEKDNVWQARVDKSVRFWFSIENDTYTLLNIANHPK